MPPRPIEITDDAGKIAEVDWEGIRQAWREDLVRERALPSMEVAQRLDDQLAAFAKYALIHNWKYSLTPFSPEEQKHITSLGAFVTASLHEHLALCNTASTLYNLIKPNANQVIGWLNDGSPKLSTHQSHEWTTDGDPTPHRLGPHATWGEQPEALDTHKTLGSLEMNLALLGTINALMLGVAYRRHLVRVAARVNRAAADQVHNTRVEWHVQKLKATLGDAQDPATDVRIAEAAAEQLQWATPDTLDAKRLARRAERIAANEAEGSQRRVRRTTLSGRKEHDHPAIALVHRPELYSKETVAELQQAAEHVATTNPQLAQQLSVSARLLDRARRLAGAMTSKKR